MEKVPENGPASRKKDRTERVIGLGSRTREEIVKWNQMTALRFQTGRRHQTSPASLRGTGRQDMDIRAVASQGSHWVKTKGDGGWRGGGSGGRWGEGRGRRDEASKTSSAND